MLKSFLHVLRREAGASAPEHHTRRRYPRRSCDRVVGVIGDRIFPVQDWSLGGVRIAGDARMFTPGREMDVTLKFKLRDQVLDVPHRARVVRKTNDSIAFEFTPLPRKVRDKFQQVVDDYVAQRFAESQMV